MNEHTRRARATGRLRFFLAAMFISSFGTYLMPNIIAYTMLESSGSNQRWFATIFLIGQVLPFLVTLSLASVVDRAGLYSKLLATQSVLALSCFTYAAFSHLYQSRIMLIIGLQAVLTALAAISTPAVTRSLTIIAVDDQWLEEAARKTTLYRSVSQLLGQGLSGVLLAAVGAGILVAINGVSFLAMLMAVFLNRHSYREADRQEDIASRRPAIGGVLGPLDGRPSYQLSLLYQLLANIVVVHPYLIFTPVILSQRLGVSDAAVRWGVQGAAFAFGAIVGAVITKRFKFSNRLSLSVGSGFLEIPMMAILALAPTSVLLIPMATVSGFQSAVSRILFSQQMFKDFPKNEVGRMASLGSLTWITSSAIVSLASMAIGSNHSTILFTTLSVVNVLVTAVFLTAVIRSEKNNEEFATI
ncbi:MFS transporter [Nocardia sp. CA-129566]|uniref:MFS transporter n=1 Tax=Nocardia sp. CA-129566 TaxID=3239976 RepID=UPI003D95A97D